MASEPLSKGGKLICGKLSSFVDSEEDVQNPFHHGVLKQRIENGRQEGGNSSKEIGMGEKPVSDGSSLFIEVFGLGDEVELGDIDSGGADHVAEMTPNAEVDPTIQRRFVRFPETLRSWASLLGSREEGRNARNRTDGHAGCTTRANIKVSFGPGGFLFHKNQKFTAETQRSQRMFSRRSLRLCGEICFSCSQRLQGGHVPCADLNSFPGLLLDQIVMTQHGAGNPDVFQDSLPSFVSRSKA